MRKAGGIVSIIAGVFGIFAALITLSVGGLGSAFKADQADMILSLGFGGLGCSALVIVLGAVALGVNNKFIGLLLFITSIVGAIFGGTFVGVCMVMSFVGSILILCSSNKEVRLPPITNTASNFRVE